MKKFLSIIAIFIVALCFSACGGSVLDLCKQNLAEVRYNVFSGETDAWTANFMSGQRENPYVVNGICEKTSDFGLLTIKFKNNDTPLTASYLLTIDTTEYKGDLEYNQYENNFMVDIGSIVSDEAIITVEVVVGTTKLSTQLESNIKTFEISWQTALNIAVESLDMQLKNYIEKGKLNGEVYVKIITDLNGSFDDYFWYISIYDRNGNSNAVIINPMSGEVAATK